MSPEVRHNDFDFALRSIKAQTPDANAMMLAMISLDAAEQGDALEANKWLQLQQTGQANRCEYCGSLAAWNHSAIAKVALIYPIKTQARRMG